MAAFPTTAPHRSSLPTARSGLLIAHPTATVEAPAAATIDTSVTAGIVVAPAGSSLSPSVAPHRSSLPTPKSASLTTSTSTPMTKTEAGIEMATGSGLMSGREGEFGTTTPKAAI